MSSRCLVDAAYALCRDVSLYSTDPCAQTFILMGAVALLDRAAEQETNPGTHFLLLTAKETLTSEARTRFARLSIDQTAGIPSSVSAVLSDGQCKLF